MKLRPAVLLAFLFALPAFAPGGASAWLTPASAPSFAPGGATEGKQQEEDPTKVEHAKIASVKADPATVKPGEAFYVVFDITILPNWHIYSANGTYAPTEWKFEGPVERAGKIQEPKPKHHKDSAVEYDYHEGEARFRIPLRLKPDAIPGPLKLKGKMTGQECDPQICVGIDTDFTVDLTVADNKTAEATPDEGHTKIVSVTAEPASAKVGETFHLVYKVRIDPGWHIYDANGTYNPTEWDFAAGVPVERAGRVDDNPKPKHVRQVLGKDDEGKDIVEEYDQYEGEVTFRVPVRFTGDAKPGPLAIKGKMTGQECSTVCIGLDVKFETGATVVEGGTAVDSEYEKHGFLGLLLLGVLGGLISLIMPCTYPMIPITLTYFVKQAAGSRRHGLALSFVYSLGIIIAFTGLGFALTLLLGAGGAREFAADPWVNIVVGGLFLWFMGSLFGWYEIKLPFGLGEKLTQGQHKGVGGAFLLGLLFSVVTFTCTIPIAGTILTIAAGQHRFAALLAMLFYSITMSVPFFLMGLFPGAIKEIPKSGGWLQTVKISMAWVEIALAVFYFSKADQTWEVGALNRSVMLVLWIAVALVVAGYLLHLLRKRPGLVRIGFALVFLGFGGYMAYGFSGKPLGLLEILVPPPPFEGTTLPAALAEAKKLNKPVFAEFTGVT